MHVRQADGNYHGRLFGRWPGYQTLPSSRELSGLMRKENRLYQRYPVSCELRGKALRSIESTAEPAPAGGHELRGVITDVGVGGVGLFSQDTIEILTPFSCAIITPEMPVGIPTLLQVRWIRKDGHGHTYRVGLQFLV